MYRVSNENNPLKYTVKDKYEKGKDEIWTSVKGETTNIIFKLVIKIDFLHHYLNKNMKMKTPIENIW